MWGGGRNVGVASLPLQLFAELRARTFFFLFKTFLIPWTRTAVLASVLVGFLREYDQTIRTVNTEGMATYDLFWDGYNEYLGQIRDF
ncbi:hypothetical protein B0H10DRAFT_2058888 [Mycena sp. CBHHK59/15]|nr:hypothetical protein B0H10DRAFT_2058888 [Mycena sp. CBHHK59/15]